MAPLNILISGTGIAGTVLAWWLLRAHPTANITLLERSPSLRLTGASVDIRSSAVDIINLMNLESTIRSHTTQESGVQFCYNDRTPFATFMATGRTDVQSITSEYEIFRGRLAQIFVEPILDKVKLIFDESVDTFTQLTDPAGGPSGVSVTFAKSRETRTYDLLVAADGLGSRIRGQMLSTSPRDQIRDEGTYAAYFTIKHDMLAGSKIAQGYNAPGGRVIYLRPDNDPAGRTRANVIVVTTAAMTETRERLIRALGEGNEAYMQLMEDLFEDAGSVAQEVLKGMRSSDDFYCSIFAHVQSPTLHSGRVVLLGDAGYATSGIGTSLAIMGGYVLAGELLRPPADIRAALRRYEELMVPFVKSQQGSVATGAMRLANPQTWWGIMCRNTVVRVVAACGIDRVAMRIAAVVGFTEKKLVLPEYEWPNTDGQGSE